MVSCMLTGAGMFMFATTNFLRSSSDTKQIERGNMSFPETAMQEQNIDSVIPETLGWLPLVSIILVAVGYHIGLSPIIWSYTGKIPQDILIKRRRYIFY